MSVDAYLEKMFLTMGDMFYYETVLLLSMGDRICHGIADHYRGIVTIIG